MTPQAHVIAAFENMRIDHRRIPTVHSTLDLARQAGKLTGRRPKRYVEFFAASHTGKTTAIKTYIEDVIVPELIADGIFPNDIALDDVAERQTRVLHVTLSPHATPRSLASDILRKLGDQRAHKGAKDILLARVYEFLGNHGVELLILDEIQHLSTSLTKGPTNPRRDTRMESTDVTDTLKRMMIEGLVPMVFVGVPEARAHLTFDVQLTNRELAKIDFSPLKWSDPNDQKTFIDYCAQAAILIQQFSLLPERSTLTEGGIAEQLWAATGGCIGLVSRLVEEAVLHVMKRNGLRVELQDLALAVDTRGIPNGYSTYNPFRTGVRSVKAVGRTT